MEKAKFEPYNIIASDSEGYYEEKKSKFISYLHYCESENDAISFIEKIKKKHYDAKHNCSAMILGPSKELVRSNDDKEPAGTAGKPILETLMGQNITNVVCVVTRYFGGTLLGTGGLIRAYSEATKDALSKIAVKTVTYCDDIAITIPYSDVNTIEYMLSTDNICVLNKEYTESVRIVVRLEHELSSDLHKSITDKTNSRAEITTINEGYFPL